MSENCFKRQEGFKGNHEGEFTSVMFDHHREMLAAIRAGEVRPDSMYVDDVFLIPRTLMMS